MTTPLPTMEIYEGCLYIYSEDGTELASRKVDHINALDNCDLQGMGWGEILGVCEDHREEVVDELLNS